MRIRAVDEFIIDTSSKSKCRPTRIWSIEIPTHLSKMTMISPIRPERDVRNKIVKSLLVSDVQLPKTPMTSTTSIRAGTLMQPSWLLKGKSDYVFFQTNRTPWKGKEVLGKRSRESKGYPRDEISFFVFMKEAESVDHKRSQIGQTIKLFCLRKRNRTKEIGKLYQYWPDLPWTRGVWHVFDERIS